MTGTGTGARTGPGVTPGSHVRTVIGRRFGVRRKARGQRSADRSLFSGDLRAPWRWSEHLRRLCYASLTLSEKVGIGKRGRSYGWRCGLIATRRRPQWCRRRERSHTGQVTGHLTPDTHDTRRRHTTHTLNAFTYTGRQTEADSALFRRR